MSLQKRSADQSSENFSADQERELMHRQILSSVSHDLKTPLASIIGSLEIYERMNTRLTPQQRESLINVALQEAYRLDNFIANILDMARLENGMVKLRHETVPVGSLIDDCVTRLGHRLKSSTVTVDAPEDLVWITTDPTLFGRVICLILDNAVKYGGTPSTIRISFGKNADGLGFLNIADNGPGIPEARREVIFSKYTRFARGDQQNAGTGLGLAICREIMRLLNGTVKVTEPANGLGTVFTINFSTN